MVTLTIAFFISWRFTAHFEWLLQSTRWAWPQLEAWIFWVAVICSLQMVDWQPCRFLLTGALCFSWSLRHARCTLSWPVFGMPRKCDGKIVWFGNVMLTSCWNLRWSFAVYKAKLGDFGAMNILTELPVGRWMWHLRFTITSFFCEIVFQSWQYVPFNRSLPPLDMISYNMQLASDWGKALGRWSQHKAGVLWPVPQKAILTLQSFEHGTARVANWHCKSCQLALQELPHWSAGRVLSLKHFVEMSLSDSHFSTQAHWDIHHVGHLTTYPVHSGAMAELFDVHCRRAHLRFLLGRAISKIPGSVAGWFCQKMLV